MNASDARKTAEMVKAREALGPVFELVKAKSLLGLFEVELRRASTLRERGYQVTELTGPSAYGERVERLGWRVTW